MNCKFWKCKLLTSIVGASIVLLILTLNISAQNIPQTASDQAAQIKAEMESLPLHLQKLSSNVYKVLKKIDAAGITRANVSQHKMAEEFSNPILDVDNQGRIHLTLRTKEITTALLSQLQNLEFEVEATTRDLNVTANHQMISGWAPFDRIERMARIADIFHIRSTDKPITNTGDVNTAGDGILRADLARSTFGVNGAGETVGVISDGVNHLANSQASADLPAGVNVINNRFGGDEGTAMLEIVHDLAPAANLAFADFASSQADFANNIMLLQGAGASVITDDIIYFLEPVYEDGVIAQTVDNVVNINDVVYTSSSNNQQLDHYEGDFVSPDGDVWHDFVTGDETINTTLGAFSQIRLVLQWNNAFGLASDDYDLFLYNSTLTAVLASSEDVQNGNDDPVEFLTFTNSTSSAITVHIAVKRTSGAARNFSIYTYGGGVTPVEHVGGDGAVYGHAGAIRNLAAGAIDASDPGNDDIESFSNHGPTRIYSYDGSGNPVSFVNRAKPAHVAIDGVQTKVGQLGFFSNPFFGTSAATPHTAGVAALVRDADPTLTAIQVGNVLNNTAVDLGPVGFDNTFGNGRIDAFNAVSSVAGTPGPITFISYTVDDDNTGNSSGNGDGFINPGETVEIFVDLRNQGTGTASGVVACISEFSPYVNGFLFNTCSGYGDMTGLTTVTNTDDFDFSVDPSAPDQHLINFALDITSPSGGPWTVSFSIPVVATAPDISVNPPSLTFNVPIGGMNTQTLTIDNAGLVDLSWNVGESNWSGTSSALSPSIDHLRMKDTELKFEDITGPPFFRNTFTKLAEGLGFSLDQFNNSAPNLITPSVIFYDDMEAGVGGWTTALVGSVDDLWHQSFTNANSPSKSWWCGDETSGNYDTGNRINTILVSPLIDLTTATAPVTLQFYENFEIEYGWDYCMVDVSTDGGVSWFHLRGSGGHDTAPTGNSGGWVLSALDLTPFIGQAINLGFYFDTTDPVNNNMPGWFIDDVFVFDNGVRDVVPWLSENPQGGSIPPSGSQNIDVTANAGIMPAGTYHASLSINNNDFDKNPITIPVELNIASTTPPDINVTPSSLSFTVPVGGATSDILTISNTAASGSDALLWNLTEQEVTVVLKDGTQVPLNISSAKLQNRTANSVNLKKTNQADLINASWKSTLKPREANAGATTSSGETPPTESKFIPSSSPLVANTVVIETGASTTNSVDRALNELGVNHDVVLTTDFTSIDFTPYETIILAMDGGVISEASVQAVANEASSGKNLIILGGTNIASYYTGVQNYLLQHNGTMGWKVSANPHLTATDPGDPLASGLPSSYDYMSPQAAYYMLRITDPAASVAATNGDGFPALVSKPIGSGNLVYSISSPTQDYYNNDPDFQILKTIIRNAINTTNCPWLSENPVSGIAAPGSSEDIAVIADASGLTAGTYNCDLMISSNDPDENPVTIPVTLNVVPANVTEFGVVTNVSDQNIQIFDVTTNAIFGPFLDGMLGTGSLVDVVITPDAQTALLSSYSDQMVFFVDVSNPLAPGVSGSVNIGFNAEDIDLTSDGAYALVTDGGGSTEIAVIDVAAMSLIQTLDVSPRQPRAVAIGPDGTVLIADYDNDQVHVLTMTGGVLNDLATALSVGDGPINIAISPDGQTGLVANIDGSTVSVLHITGPGVVSVSGSVTNIMNPQSIAFRPSGSHAFVLETGTSPDNFAILNVNAPGNVTDSGLRVNLLSDESAGIGFYGVDALDISSDGSHGYVGNPASSSGNVTNVAVVDINNLSLTSSLPAGLIPVGIAVSGASCTPGILGDVNGDGFANSTDALIILSYDAGVPLPAPILDRINMGFGNGNGDGTTNSTDALLIISFDVGITVPFPIGNPVCL